MWPFNPKTYPPRVADWTIVEHPQKTEDMIELKSDDNYLQRGEKIWKLLGFVNDRHGSAAKIAAYLRIYDELEEKAQNKNVG